MKKLIIEDTGHEYIIENENDLYIMYNDFLIDADPFEEMQTILIIREFYSSIYSKIARQKYSIDDFEKIALEIADVSELNEEEFILNKKIESLKDWGERQKAVIESIEKQGFKNVIDSELDYEDWLEYELIMFIDKILNL